MGNIVFIAIALSILFSPAFAVLELPNAQPKVGAKQWKQVLDSTWQGLVRRNIDECVGKLIYTGHPSSSGLICRPKSETPWDAVSEGIGYGMLLALYSNDQYRFNQIYKAGKEFHLNYCQGWRKPADGSGTESGSATDADEDIAIALVFADKLAKKGLWESPSDINYAGDAQNAIDCVWRSMDNGKLCPGNGWCPGFNVGYFAPAWYRIFKDYKPINQSHNWQLAINESYNLIESVKNTGYTLGMVPDWSAADGTPGGGGYNTYSNGQVFFKDAIRVLWRIATDAIWFNEPRAKTFLTNSLTFIKGKGGPGEANFYKLNGELINNDKWTQFNDQNNSNTWRYRREHSHLTVGQWLTAAMAVGTDDDKIAWSSKMAEFYDWENKVDFFGNAVDPTGGIEDTLHNEMYFDQFLAWFGVSLMSGTWVNIIDVLDNPIENDVEGITVQPFLEPEPPDYIKKNHIRHGIQITQSRKLLQMRSQSDVVWKIHNLQGKLLFSSNSRETSWNSGNFKGAVVVSAVSKSNAERRLLVVK